MIRYFCLFAFISLFAFCKKEENSIIVPACIDQKIKLFEIEDACKTGASVNEYLFQNNIVYTFDPGICVADGEINVYTENCVLLGVLGTIAGNEEIKGINFSKNATLIKLIWKN